MSIVARMRCPARRPRGAKSHVTSHQLRDGREVAALFANVGVAACLRDEVADTEVVRDAVEFAPAPEPNSAASPHCARTPKPSR